MTEEDEPDALIWSEEMLRARLRMCDLKMCGGAKDYIKGDIPRLLAEAYRHLPIDIEALVEAFKKAHPPDVLDKLFRYPAEVYEEFLKGVIHDKANELLGELVKQGKIELAFDNENFVYRIPSIKK